MESIEVVLFLVFSIIVASMIIAFITGFDFNSFNEFVNNLMNPDKETKGINEVDMYGFAKASYDCWSSCSFGAEDKNCSNVLIKPNEDFNLISKQQVQSFFEKINLCSDCNIVMSEVLELPQIVSMKCESNSLKIQ